MTICIDMGTSRICALVSGKGVVINEPNLAAIDSYTGEILAFGDALENVKGRNPASFTVQSSVENGRIVKYDLCEKILKFIIDRLCGERVFRPDIRITTHSGTDDLEERVLRDMLKSCGARSCEILSEGYCAAMGAGAGYTDKAGTCVLNIGAGKTDFALVAGGELISSLEVPFGGNLITQAVQNFAREKKLCEISFDEAEKLKLQLGSAMPSESDIAFTVSGKDTQSSLPRLCEISNTELFSVVTECLTPFTKELRSAFELIPPEFAEDIDKRGVILTGGCSNLSGISKYLSYALELDTVLTPEPGLCAVKGLDRSKIRGGLFKAGRHS